MQGMEGLAVKDVRLEIQHRRPDPHGGKDLNEGQPPVGEDQFQSLEQHGEPADHDSQRCKDAPAVAQLKQCGLDGGIVALADRPYQPADLVDKHGPTRAVSTA